MISRNIALLPWFAFLRNLVFWQATWFLYFQSELSAPQAILLYVVYDVTTTALEVPSGYMSDRLGRRFTLLCAGLAGAAGSALLALGLGGFGVFILAQALLGAHAAFVSGTDSAMLYESLDAEGRADEIERQEVRVWRFSFAALALSAVTGGAVALWAPAIPFALSALAFLALIWLAWRLVEPPHKGTDPTGPAMNWTRMRGYLRQPVLLWLFVLSVLMYGYSHIPFVFGQPFILNALQQGGLDGQAPFVSGVVSSIMMILSVFVSLFAPALRRRMGLGALLLLAFGMQVALAGMLGLTSALWAIGLLFLRMVPDSLSRPFIIARMQPLLEDDSRATFLSLKSFFGRLVFALSLMLAAGSARDVGLLSHAEMQPILWAYAGLGLACLATLAFTARKLSLDQMPETSHSDR